jgi:hypothetical protein
MSTAPYIEPAISFEDATAIIAAVTAKTNEVITEVRLGEYGPEVQTGRVYGHVWQVRKGKSGWKVLYGHQWC